MADRPAHPIPTGSRLARARKLLGETHPRPLLLQNQSVPVAKLDTLRTLRLEDGAGDSAFFTGAERDLSTPDHRPFFHAHEEVLNAHKRVFRAGGSAVPLPWLFNLETASVCKAPARGSPGRLLTPAHCARRRPGLPLAAAGRRSPGTPRRQS